LEEERAKAEEERGGSQKLSIFLSYRRDDVPFAVGLLTAMLSDRLSPDTIFLDTIVNRRGLSTASGLSRALARSAAVLCVIGPEWDDESHLRRLADANDFVRRELETALSQGVPVIPVFVDREPDRKVAASLPAGLEPLSALPPSPLRKESLAADADALIHRLRGILDARGDAYEPEMHQGDQGDVAAVLGADLVRRGIEEMLRHVLPLPQQSSKNLEHLAAATAVLLPPGEWLRYLATGHLPGRPSGSALVVVTDRALRIGEMGSDFGVRKRYEMLLSDILDTDLVRRRRLGLLDVGDVTFQIKNRPPVKVMGIFGDRAAGLSELLRRLGISGDQAAELSELLRRLGLFDAGGFPLDALVEAAMSGHGGK
jgi:hypothetical protein